MTTTMKGTTMNTKVQHDERQAVTDRSGVSPGDVPANIATVHHRRQTLPVLSLLVAGAAVALGALAIATDDVSSITPQPRPAVTTTVVGAQVPAPPVADPEDAATAADHCDWPRTGLVS
jgi:hypothetical protein